MDLAPDFDEFCGLLNAHRVEFAIVGAYALALHGVPRYTGDLDILVRPTLENAGRLLDAIRDFGFPIDQLSPECIVDPARLLQLGTPPVQVHVMSAIDGVTWDAVWGGHEVATAGIRRLPFIGRQALVANKRAAARPKDLADLDALGEASR